MQRVYNQNVLHSFVDLITNSSSVVYIMANGGAPATLHKLVNGLLGAVGSELTSEELFDIRIIPDFESVDDIGEDLRDNLVDALDDEALVDDFIERFNAADWSESTKVLSRFYAEHYDKVSRVSFSTQNEYGYENSSIQVTPKREDLKEVAGILSSLDSLFSYEASYDG